jgi:Ni,Fe-hydrogenase III small subunit/formate hydrogenlyase subunit 6/NADH:ubiquinone oxidoreductase subunit I
MFQILRKSLRTGTVTIPYPKPGAPLTDGFRGQPVFDFEQWRDARPAAEACPTGAIAIADAGAKRTVTVDYGRCTFCGECAAASGGEGVRNTSNFELAVTDRKALVVTAEYALAADGTHQGLISGTPAEIGRAVHGKIHRVLGRSLAIREVDSGSCNACELEAIALNNPVYDIERFGIHFVASPRHADMLLVTGPVTRNMELALRKTFNATPDPKVVVAVGACGISGGIFGVNYATLGGVDQVLPVDVYVPGCPPRPEALLHGILLAVGRIESRRQV